MKKAKIIAEIGCNHKGDLEIAKEMIKVAKDFCNVDCVKFQKRDNKYWATIKPDQYYAPHPDTSNSYGETYLEHREALEFNTEQHEKLLNFCIENNIEYSTSVWDINSAKEIVDLKPGMIKIPSACNNNIEILKFLCENYLGEIHVSTGMSYQSEINEIVNFFDSKNRLNDLILYSCTSGYPVPFEDVCLFEILKLKESYGNKIKDLGFSGHHLGIAVDISAYTLGATIIERHFTLDRTWKGTDHAASLEPDGMRRLVRDLRAVEKALSYKSEEILPIEKKQRNKLKY